MSGRSSGSGLIRLLYGGGRYLETLRHAAGILRYWHASRKWQPGTEKRLDEYKTSILREVHHSISQILLRIPYKSPKHKYNSIEVSDGKCKNARAFLVVLSRGLRHT